MKHYLTKFVAMLITAAMVCSFGLLKSQAAEQQSISDVYSVITDAKSALSNNSISNDNKQKAIEQVVSAVKKLSLEDNSESNAVKSDVRKLASIPGALKNVFDLLPVNAFRDKVIGLVATAGSSKHYLIPEMHLKPILSYMKAHTMQTYVFIEEKDFSNQQIVNDDVVFRLKALAQSTMRTAKVQQQVFEEENNQYDF